VIATAKGESKINSISNGKVKFFSLDITDGAAVNKLMDEVRPDVLLHTAAMTQVDECELNKIDCWNTNVTATRFLIDSAKKRKVESYLFLLISYLMDSTVLIKKKTSPIRLTIMEVPNSRRKKR
jgi:dTDP-4-dehydrorhamnose reductase